MSVLAMKTRGPARPWRTPGPSPGPTIPIETGVGTSDRSRAPLDHPADAIRAHRLLGLELRYIAHPSFDDPAARDAILAPMPAPAVSQAPRRRKAPVGIPPYLASLYDEGPLLSREQEAHLFRKMNYLMYRAGRLRDRIDPARALAADLDEIERLLDEALAIRNQLVRANLRLVVFIAKRRLGPHDDQFERVSDGNYVLLRAVERFDYSLGNKFSTYATWVIRNHFARAFRGKNLRHPRILLMCDEVFAVAADPRPDELEQSDLQERRREAVARLLARLDDRERRIIASRYGIGGADEMTLKQIGKELGITKERVRQIETRAHQKLRGLAQGDELELLPA